MSTKNSSKGPRTGTGNTGTASKPWYAAGLRFTCVPECGRCCTSHEDYAYVYLDDDDLPRLAAHLELDDKTFRQRYTAIDDGDVVLKMDEPDCPFLEGSRCGVYEARPTQCRTFPFWAETLKSRAGWRRNRRFCPGIDEGELQPLRVIQEHLAARNSD